MGNSGLAHRHGLTYEVVANGIALPLQSGFGSRRIGHLGLIVTKNIRRSDQGNPHHPEFIPQSSETLVKRNVNFSIIA